MSLPELSTVVIYTFISIGIAAPLGLIAGVIPGVGGKVALAIAAPLMASTDPMAAMVVLLSMHAVIRLGGALPAIVLGVPGSSADAAMVVHGYPMSQQGQTSRAVLATSLAGALSGIMGLWLFVTVAMLGADALARIGAETRLALFVGAFVLIVLSEASGRVVAGIVLIAGVLLSLFSEGEDGQRWVPLLPTMLGLLVVPSLLAVNTMNDVGESRDVGARSSRRVDVLSDLWPQRYLWIASSALGWVCGMAPGVGATAISWMALSLKRLLGAPTQSKDHDNIAGLVAPIAGTMAKEGGALVTTLLLGIPGSSAMIIIVSVLIDFEDRGRPRIDDIVGYQVIWLGAVVSLAILVSARLAPWLARQLVRVRTLPENQLRTVSLLLVSVSVMVTHFTLLALLTFCCASAMGVLMNRNNIARVPLIIGFILGADAVGLTSEVFRL